MQSGTICIEIFLLMISLCWLFGFSASASNSDNLQSTIYNPPLKSKLPPLVSRDESLVSQEPMKHIFRNKLQAIGLRGNN